ncbi:hypothetical protein C8R43DRAFT_1133048 [Mycena crocata]|nr:hypothetical protein C8R43DRAFT_1133048 [Mycena crocata]
MPTSNAGIVKEDTLYVIPALTPEKERLPKQYAMKKAMYGWKNAVPDAIDLSRIRNVLDIGAGTCIWTLDLANAPQIKARSSEVQFYACDIDAKFFPPASLTDEIGLKTFEQDVSKDFPVEYHGIFDLVHISFLFLCLTEDGWNAAIANVQQLLSLWLYISPVISILTGFYSGSGGRVMIDELDPILFKEDEDTRPLNGRDYDLDKCMSGPSWVNKLNCLYTGFIVKNNFVVGLTLRLSDMLDHAGLTVEHTEVRTGPVGKLCMKRKGGDGGSLAAYEEFSIENMEYMVTQFLAIMVKEGTLEVPPGNLVMDEEEIKAILGEIRHGLKTEGAIAVGGCFVARKL